MSEFAHIGRQIDMIEGREFEKARQRFVLAAATIERDVRLHDLTGDETERLVRAVLGKEAGQA